jgi:hypothetical protein
VLLEESRRHEAWPSGLAMVVCDNLAIEQGMVPQCNMRSTRFGRGMVGAWECASGGYQPACLCSACMARPAHG